MKTVCARWLTRQLDAVQHKLDLLPAHFKVNLTFFSDFLMQK